MNKLVLLIGTLSLMGCEHDVTKVKDDQTKARGINNPCLDNPNSGSSLCTDQSQNLAMIPPVEVAPPLPETAIIPQ